MPPSPTKTLSPAELQKLEHAFASDPSSDAYRPLAEAYLAMGRFMEAMVVCKKGVKAHPSVADPRVLLARVYAEQGKDKKALEELQEALKVAPADRAALRLTGSLQLKGGDAAGKANLLKAWEADPKDEETLAAMQQFKVDAPQPVAPPPPPPMMAPPVLAPVQVAHAQSMPTLPDVRMDSPPPTLHPVTGQSAQALSAVQAPVAHAPAPRHAPGPNGAAAQVPAPPPQAKPRPKPQPRRVEAHEDSYDSSSQSFSSMPSKKKKQGSNQRAIFFLMIVMIPVLAGGFWAYKQYKGKQVQAVRKALNEAVTQLKYDTFDSYKKACANAETALDADPNSPGAHAVLAYAYTVRWGEHEHDDAMRGRAEEHIKAANEHKDKDLAYLFAAEALFKYYSGKGNEGLTTLEERIKDAESQNKRGSLLYLTQGLISMSLGDLEHAKEALDKAQSITSDDPRIYVALGNLARRRGNDMQALQAFNASLRFSRNSHPDGLLGTALLVLDQENPGDGYVSAARYLKTLLESEPAPSSRQLAAAHYARAFLVSRVAADVPLYTNKDVAKKILEGTTVPAEASAAKSEIQKEEHSGASLDRSNPDLNIIKGKRLSWEGKYDEAAAEIQKAVDANATLANYHVELAKVFLKKEGGEAQAEAALKKALELVPGSPKLLALQGQAQYRQKKIEAARQTLEQATNDSKTKNPEARYLLGKIYRDDKRDYDKAAVMLEKAAQEYFQDPTMAATAYDDLGQAFEAKNDKDKARAAFEKALNADADYDQTYCHYARFLTKVGDAKDKEKIRAAATEYVRRNPNGRSDCVPDMQRLASGG